MVAYVSLSLNAKPDVGLIVAFIGYRVAQLSSVLYLKQKLAELRAGAKWDQAPHFEGLALLLLTSNDPYH